MRISKHSTISKMDKVDKNLNQFENIKKVILKKSIYITCIFQLNLCIIKIFILTLLLEKNAKVKNK